MLGLKEERIFKKFDCATPGPHRSDGRVLHFRLGRGAKSYSDSPRLI